MIEYFKDKYFAKRFIFHLIIKTILFIPTFFVISVINIESAKIIGYTPHGLFPLVVIALVILPFPIIMIEIWGYIVAGVHMVGK